MRLLSDRVRIFARRLLLPGFAVVFASLAGCADQEASYLGAKAMDPSLQSGLGNPERDRPVLVPPPADAQLSDQPRYQWNGNPQRVIEGKPGSPGTKTPKLQPQPPSQMTRASGNVPTGSELIEVQPGDTLHGIAERYGVTVATLSQANRLSGAPLQVGQKLVLPAAAR